MDKKQVQLLKEVFLQVDNSSKGQTQVFLKFWEILDYLRGNKTPEFVHRLEKEYPILKEFNIY